MLSLLSPSTRTAKPVRDQHRGTLAALSAMDRSRVQLSSAATCRQRASHEQPKLGKSKRQSKAESHWSMLLAPHASR